MPASLDEPPFAAVVDALGVLCPLPVLRLRKRLRPLAQGSRVRLLADDPAALIDVPHFCHQNGHVLHHTAQSGTTLLFDIEKGGSLQR
ncbi:MAG: sulfurtransferase TusA family protein [Rhodobacteraceae bacterium]|nr:sulfurtransferase TusA family protein [Paracoccaceae bacterium]